MVVPRVGCSHAYCATEGGTGKAAYCCTSESAKSPSTESAESCTAERTQDCKSHPNHMFKLVGREILNYSVFQVP